MINFNIIIPTYNRPSYLERIISYYSQFGESYNIIVADSSSDENKRRNKENILLFPNLTILYLGDYPSSISPFNKIADAVNYVKGEYCVICPDDDFITPNGIRKCVDFLENNPDFTVAHGNCILFYFKKNNFHWVSDKQFNSINFSDAKSRLDFHLSNYQVTTFYAVHRTNFLKMILEENLKFTDDNRFGELLPSMLTLIYGKMKRLEVLFIARDFDSVPMAAGQKYFYRLQHFIKNGTYDEKYTKFKNCLAFHLNKKSNLSLEESKRIIDNAMSFYMKKNYPNNYKYFLMNQIKNMLNFLPENMRNKIKSFYGLLKLNFSKSGEKFSEILDNADCEYREDLLKINDCIMSNFKIYEK